MAKEVITFRIDDDLRSKLSHLQQLDAEASLKQKRKPKGRSEIIAEAIQAEPKDVVTTYWHVDPTTLIPTGN